LYHSPGLRDGVPAQGTRVRPDHPTIVGAELTSAWIILAGNKFGRLRVFRLGWDYPQTVLGCDPIKPCEEFFIFVERAAQRNSTHPLL
jgi:hypothetical protein